MATNQQIKVNIYYTVDGIINVHQENHWLDIYPLKVSKKYQIFFLLLKIEK